MSTFLGTSGYTTYEVEGQYNKFPTYTNTYVGLATDVDASASAYFAKGWNIKTTQGAGDPMKKLVATLQCQTGGDGLTPVSTTSSYKWNWSMHTNIAEKELLYCNTWVIPWINNITTNDKILLESLLINGSGSLNTSGFTGGSASISASQVVWTMALNGQKTAPVTQPIVKMDLVAPYNVDLTVIKQNELRIYAKASVLAEQPTLLSNYYAQMQQPSDPSGLVTDNGSTIPLLYGWQKQPATIDQNGITCHIQQEWWFGLFPQNLFLTRI